MTTSNIAIIINVLSFFMVTTVSHHIYGQGRHQSTLFPETLDDFVGEHNPVRVIDVFIDELDLLALGFKRVVAKKTGRPGYHPATLLKLYVYGYLNRIQSSRRLETECKRNVELMWLLERLSPDFKTIADFRRDNANGIKNACRQFVEICRRLNMFGSSDIVIDGSKFKACNNKTNNYTPSKIKAHIARVEKNISQYLEQLDEADKQEMPDSKMKLTQERLNEFRKQLKELHELKRQVEKHPDKQVSTTDPDSRLMKTRGANRVVCYNVQSAVDTKHHLIVAHEVTNMPDRGQLHATAVLAQKALKRKALTVYADKGYYSGKDIKETQDAGMIPLVPKGDTSGAEKKGIFNRALFKYDKEKDVYICPNNSELTPGKTKTCDKGIYTFSYRASAGDCQKCDLRSQCTTSQMPRKISRWEHQNQLDKMDDLLKQRPEAMLIRKQTVEHPFGTIKCWMGMTHLLTRRLKNVRTELNLHVLAYNFKRMLTIMGSKGLIEAIKAPT